MQGKTENIGQIWFNAC